MCQRSHKFFHLSQALVAFLALQPYHEPVEVPCVKENYLLEKILHFICTQKSKNQRNYAIWKVFVYTEYWTLTKAMKDLSQLCSAYC